MIQGEEFGCVEVETSNSDYIVSDNKRSHVLCAFDCTTDTA